MTHYERLGVPRDASSDDLRAAYRRAARRLHPDANGERSAVAMAEVNQAWWVLRDRDRRAVYDDELRVSERRNAPASASPGGSQGTADPGVRAAGSSAAAHNPLARYQDPPRFPWRFMSVLAALGILVVILGVVLQSPSTPLPVDNVLGPGSCVVLQTNGDAAEVACSGTHDAVVQVLVPIGDRCPVGTEPHRDRQGMGTACVTTAG